MDARAAYDFGVAKVLGSYQQVKDALGIEATPQDLQIGAAVPVGAGNVPVAWASSVADAAATTT